MSQVLCKVCTDPEATFYWKVNPLSPKNEWDLIYFYSIQIKQNQSDPFLIGICNQVKSFPCVLIWPILR